METRDMLADAFGRVVEDVEGAVAGLTAEQLAFRPDPDANSIAWLVWHLARVHDDHVMPELHAAYAPEDAWSGRPRVLSAEELMAEAVMHGDEHVIKLADAVIDAHLRSGDPLVLAAGARSLDLIARPYPSGGHRTLVGPSGLRSATAA